MDQDFASQRQRMVQEQIARRGITDTVVLTAMRSVPRHLFVPHSLIASAYEDGPLPIGEGQTISQPYIVALMVQAAKITKDSKVLEIGTGCGYAAAVLATIAKEVHTIERLEKLAKTAEVLLERLNYQNVTVHLGDGTLGLSSISDFDAILVTAGAPIVPQALLDQVKEGGRIVIPVGNSTTQQLLCLTKLSPSEFSQEEIALVRFVPLIGEQGWKN